MSTSKSSSKEQSILDPSSSNCETKIEEPIEFVKKSEIDAKQSEVKQSEVKPNEKNNSNHPSIDDLKSLIAATYPSFDVNTIFAEEKKKEVRFTKGCTPVRPPVSFYPRPHYPHAFSENFVR